MHMDQKQLDDRQNTKLDGRKGNTETKTENENYRQQGLPILRHSPPAQPRSFQTLAGVVCWAWGTHKTAYESKNTLVPQTYS